jgi:hypothetical protein
MKTRKNRITEELDDDDDFEPAARKIISMQPNKDEILALGFNLGP